MNDEKREDRSDTSRAAPETVRLGTNFLETEESEVEVSATVETSMVSN